MAGEVQNGTASVPGILSDCRVMLRFVLKESIGLPEDLRGDIAILDQILKRHNLPPISGLPTDLIEDLPQSAANPPIAPTNAIEPVPQAGSAVEAPASGASSQPGTLPVELALKVHIGLSKLVAPATAFTLQLSEPPPGIHGFLAGMPPLVKSACWTALFCALGFVLTALPAASSKLPATSEQNKKAADAQATKDKPGSDIVPAKAP